VVGKGRKVGAFILGGGLLIALVVTMVRISGPASESSGSRGLLKREAKLGEKAREILGGVARTLPTEPGPPLLGPPEIRFDGQVLRIPVSTAWDALPQSRRQEIVTRISSTFVGAWQEVMKSRREPAIVFVEGGRRVALHTRIDHWVLPSPPVSGPD
jgi:hypothetical protein